MTATTSRKLAEIRAAGTAGVLVKTGLTAGIRELRTAGLVTIEVVDSKRGPSGCGWYLVTIA